MLVITKKQASQLQHLGLQVSIPGMELAIQMLQEQLTVLKQSLGLLPITKEEDEEDGQEIEYVPAKGYSPHGKKLGRPRGNNYLPLPPSTNGMEVKSGRTGGVLQHWGKGKGKKKQANGGDWKATKRAAISNAIKSAWSKMTPEERSVEMKRRQAVGEQNKLIAAKEALRAKNTEQRRNLRARQRETDANSADGQPPVQDAQ